MNWIKVKLPDVLFFQEGPGVRNHQFTSAGVKLLNVGNINDGKIDLTTTKIHISESEAFGKYRHFLVDEGDLIIASSGIVVDNFHNKIGFIAKQHLPLCMNTSTIRFKTLDSKVLDIKYFYYYLQTKYFTNQIRKLITGSAQLNFGPSHLKQVDLLLPPLPVQKKIAAILDKADSVRQKDKQLLEHHNKLAQSIFYDVFGDPVRNEKGWNFISLSDHGNFKNGLNYSRDEKGFEVSCLGVADFKSRWAISENEKLSKISLSSLPSAEYFLKDGDLVFVRSNGNKELIGRCVMIRSRKENTTFSGFCIRYRPNDVSCSRYLAHLFRIPSFKKYMLQNGRGANIQNINQELLGSLRVPFPKIELQKQFSIRIDQIELLKSKCENSIQETDKLFASLTQRAFKGKLVKEP